MATVLLLGLDDSSAETLSKFALQAGHNTRREAMRTTFETRPSEDLIILSGDGNTYRDALASLKEFHEAPPVLVVSRLGEPSGWIEALGAGAADFIAAPYTFAKVQSAIEAALARPKAFAA